ncbi:MAG: type II secretion system protein J [Bacteroidia bacterium]
MRNTVLNKRVNGFTIIELLVTMTLSSFVILFMYSTLNKTQQLFYSYKEQNKYITDVVLLKSILVRKVEQSDCIEAVDNCIVLKGDSLNLTMKCMNNKVLLITNLRTDTFFLDNCKLEEQYLSGFDFVKENVYVNEFKVISNYGKQEFILSFTKNYDSSVLLNKLIIK